MKEIGVLTSCSFLPLGFGKTAFLIAVAGSLSAAIRRTVSHGQAGSEQYDWQRMAVADTLHFMLAVTGMNRAESDHTPLPVNNPV